MMKLWNKMKLHRRKKEGINNAKKSVWAKDVVKQSSRATSTAGISANVSLNSCLKKSDYETDNSVADGKKSESVATGVDSVSANDTTATTSGSSAGAKKVRFTAVEIRNYERIASDNPCCTSGPPIGIGWNHDATHTENIDDYEKRRGSRRFNLEIVLSRNEREALLLEWAVDMKTIATSTRAAMKTKFQRKQTFINSRKLSKLEEVIEKTSRKFKDAFLLNRRVNGEGNESPELTTSQSFPSDHSGAGETASVTSVGEDNKSHLHVIEPDGDMVENLMQGSFDVPAAGACNEGDEDDASNRDDFTLGATTLGNTSAFSPSVTEIEKFYRELELEMFGEEVELPSMVGQTLEVPLATGNKNTNTNSRDNVKVQDETSFHQNSSCNLQSDIQSYRDESQRDSYGDRFPRLAQDVYETYEDPKLATKDRTDQHYFTQHKYNQSAFTHAGSQSLDDEYDRSFSNLTNSCIAFNDSMSRQIPYCPVGHGQTIPFPRSRPDPNYTQDPSDFYAQMHPQRYSYPPYIHQRGISFDSSYDTAARQYSNQYPRCIPTSSSRYAADLSFRYSDPGTNYSQSCSRRTSRESNFGEPRVHYMPMRGSFSANEWMDTTDQDPYFCKYEAIVTITEDRY